MRFRIDGILHQVYQLPAPVMPAVTARLKVLGRLDVTEKRRPLDGRIRTRSPDGKEVELRVSSMPTAFGEKLVLIIFNPDVLVRDFNLLGFSPPHRAVGRLECRQTGYLGRTGVYELMPVNNALRAEMSANSGLDGLRRLAIRSGMRPLRATAAEKVAQGLTSTAEVISLTPDPRQDG